MIVKATKGLSGHVREWLDDFDSYKVACRRLGRWSLSKKKVEGSHVLKDRLGYRTLANLMLRLIPETDLPHMLNREQVAKFNEYLDANREDILRYGYISEEFTLDHKTKTSAKGGALVRVDSYLPINGDTLVASNFFKVFNNRSDYDAALQRERRLAPLLDDVVLMHSIASDQHMVMAYPFVDGRSLFDEIKDASHDERLAYVAKASDLLVEVHLRGEDVVKDMPDYNLTADFKRYFFERAAGNKIKKDSSLDELLELFDAEISTALDGEKKSLVHGDAKTKNVLVRKDGSPILIDSELARKDTIHYDLYRFLDSANVEEMPVLFRVFNKLQSRGFYDSDYCFDDFKRAYDLNKIVGDFMSASRIIDIANTISDPNEQDSFSALASRYYTRALKQLEDLGMHKLRDKMRNYVGESGMNLEALTEERYDLVCRRFDLADQGLTTILGSEGAHLRFPIKKKRSKWLTAAVVVGGLTLAALGSMPVYDLPIIDEIANVDMEASVVNLDVLLNPRFPTQEDEMRIKKDPLVDRYFRSSPGRYGERSGKTGYLADIVDPRADRPYLLSFEGLTDIEHNPTILSDEQYDDLFENHSTRVLFRDDSGEAYIEASAQGLNRRLIENAAKYSDLKDFYSQYDLLLRAVVFTNLVDTPLRKVYLDEGCSNLTLQPKYIYERYGYDLGEESLEGGEWIDLVADYLKDLILIHKGDMMKVLVSYYNNALPSTYAKGIMEKRRRDVSFYKYDKVAMETGLNVTRYDPELDDAMKYMVRQVAAIVEAGNETY